MGDKLTSDLVKECMSAYGYSEVDLYNFLLEEIPTDSRFRRIYEDAFFTMRYLPRNVYSRIQNL